ncbi:MAG: hypothetical protein DRP42_06515, partial [Tenericutes bacterium]
MATVEKNSGRNRPGWITSERSFLPSTVPREIRSLYSNILHFRPRGGAPSGPSALRGTRNSNGRSGELRSPHKEGPTFRFQHHQGGSLLNAQVDHFLSVDNSYKEKNDNDCGTTYRPVINYNDRHGTKHTVISKIDHSFENAKIGENFEIIYEAHNPQNALITSDTDKHAKPIVFVR